MGASGGFPIDLVLFGMIAAFLVLRLRSILGRRTGFERPAAALPGAGRARRPGPVIDGKAEAAQPAANRAARSGQPDRPDAGARCGRSTATSIRRAFLNGAEKAFRMIVAAFAAGDRARSAACCRMIPTAAFEQAIAGREAAGENAGERDPWHPQRHHRECRTARPGRNDHCALRVRSGQPDPGQGRTSVTGRTR